KIRIKFDSFVEQTEGLLIPLSGRFINIGQSAQKKVISTKAFGWFPPGTLDFCLFKPRRDYAHYTCRHLVLQLKDILNSTFETIRPKVYTRRGIDKLPRNADPIGRFSDTAFEQVAHAQFAAHLLNVHGPALVREARIAGDHKQPAETRQSGSDFLNHPIGKVFLLWIAAHVLEWQNSNRRPIG